MCGVSSVAGRAIGLNGEVNDEAREGEENKIRISRQRA